MPCAAGDGVGIGHTLICGPLALVAREQEVDKSCTEQREKHKRDEAVVVEHCPHAEHGTDKRECGKERVQGRFVAAVQVRLLAAQAEESQHAEDIHQDRAEDGHSNDVGGESLTAEGDELVAVDGGDADDTSGENCKPWRLEAWVHMSEKTREISGAGEREDLARVAEDDSMERRDQAEESEPDEHVQPAAARSDDDLHRLRQRVVDVGELCPVACRSGKEHDTEGQRYQGKDASNVGDRDGALWVFGFFGGHGNAFDREEEPYREWDRGEDSGNRMRTEVVLAGPSSLEKVGETEAGCDDGHED